MILRNFNNIFYLFQVSLGEKILCRRRISMQISGSYSELIIVESKREDAREYRSPEESE